MLLDCRTVWLGGVVEVDGSSGGGRWSHLTERDRRRGTDPHVRTLMLMCAFLSLNGPLSPSLGVETVEWFLWKTFPPWCPWNRTNCSLLTSLCLKHTNLPLFMCRKIFKSPFQRVRVSCQDFVEKRRERWLRLSHASKPNTQRWGRTFVVSHPSYNWDLSSVLLRNGARDWKVRGMDREREEGVKQLIWAIIWLHQRYSDQCEIWSRTSLTLSNAGLQQVYRKWASNWFMFHFISSLEVSECFEIASYEERAQRIQKGTIYPAVIM